MNNKPVFLLLPGMDGTGALFRDFASCLVADMQIIIAAYPTDQALNYDALTEFATRFVPDSGRFWILGESFSGPIAVRLAERYAARVEGVVLCCSFVANPLPWLTAFAPLVSYLPISRLPRWLVRFCLLEQHTSSAILSDLQHAIAQVSTPSFRTRLHAVLQVDERKRLATLNVPVLYLRATNDRVVPNTAYKTVLTGCANTKLVELNGPHCLLQTYPQQTAAVIRMFVQHIVQI